MIRVEIDDNLKVDGVVDITHATASDRFPDAPTQIGGFVLDSPRGAVVDGTNRIPFPPEGTLRFVRWVPGKYANTWDQNTQTLGY